MQIFRKVTIFILLFVSFVNLHAQNWDIEQLQKLNHIESTKGYSTFISESTTQVEIATPLIMGAFAWIKKDDELLKNSIYTCAGLVVNEVLTLQLKRMFDRPRPAVTYPDLIHPYRNLQRLSFPSGHTSSAFNLATSLTLKYPKWYVAVPTYFWASSVGYSRMNLGVHYPSDVAAGAVLGAGSAYVTYLANNWFWKKLQHKKLISNNNIWAENSL